MPNAGLHHVTAIAGDAASNRAFYEDILGLRLVKSTVNFDDPGTRHLYFGDEGGRPGTILTFFPWSRGAKGRAGLGYATETAFRAPQASLGFWTHRFVEKAVAHGPVEKRFGRTVLPFQDRDGTSLALVFDPAAEGENATGRGEIGAEFALRGFAEVTLLVGDAAPTAAVLTDVFGWMEVGREGTRARFSSGGEGAGSLIDLREAPGFLKGALGTGVVHHVAFRASDDAAQAGMVAIARDKLGLHVTEQKDRTYFRSVYFREPGGVLFEIATDAPGFTVDEPLESLGETLKLPAGLESRRAVIEAALPPLHDERNDDEEG
jgi:glyoxalase family protein